MKIGLIDIPPLWFASARLLLGAATLFVISGRRLQWPHRSDLPAFLSVSLFQFVVSLGCSHLALTVVAPGRSAILAYTTPLWIVPMAAFWLGEKLDGWRLSALALGFAGIAVLFNPLQFAWRDESAVIANMLLLIGALAWAIAIVQVRGHRWFATPFAMLPWQMLLAGLVLAVFAHFWHASTSVQWTGRLVLILIYNGPIASAFCFWAFMTVARRLPATTTALGSLGVPVLGLLLSAVWLGEPLSADKIAGLTLIGGAVGLLLRQEMQLR